MKTTLSLDHHEIATLAALTNIETMISTLEDNFGLNMLKQPKELSNSISYIESMVTEVGFRSNEWIKPENKFFKLNEIRIRFKNLKSDISLMATFNKELKVYDIKISCEINGFVKNTTRILKYSEGLISIFIEIVLLSYNEYLESFEKFWEDIPF